MESSLPFRKLLLLLLLLQLQLLLLGIQLSSVLAYLLANSIAKEPITKRARVNNSIQFNSIQFFIIYVASQQLESQLQTQHSVGTRIVIVLQ
jgi:hypothetical protein